MTHEAIGQVLAAEEQAEVLCRVSLERAAEMKSEMEKSAAAHLSEVVDQIKATYEERLSEIKVGTAALLERKRIAAEAEAAEVRERAEKKVERAINLMVWGIVEKCQ